MSAKQASEGGVKQNLTIRFSAEEIAWLNEIAEKEYRPVASMVRYIVAQYRKGLEAKKEYPLQALLDPDAAFPAAMPDTAPKSRACRAPCNTSNDSD